MKVASLLVLFGLQLLCLGILTEGQPKASPKCSKECGRFTSRIPERRIKSYRRTEPQCFKQAIIFMTQKNVEMCANPGEDWVKKVMQILDRKKASVASSLPHAATSAAVPEDPGIFHKQVGLGVTAPSQATAPSSASQGAGRPVLDGTNAPALETGVSSKPTQATLPTQVPTASSPVMWDIAARSEMGSEANGDSTKATAPPTTFATGTGPSQSLAPVQGFGNSVGSIEEHRGYTTNAQVPDMTSPILNSDPVSITKAPDYSVGSTDGSRGPTSTTADTSDATSRSFHSDLPSILRNTPITPFPEATSVSTLNSTAVTNEGLSDPANKVFHSWTDVFDIRTPGHSSGKPDLPDAPTFTSQTFSGQARAWLTTEKTNAPPFPSFLSRSQARFVIIVASVAGGVIACSAAAAAAAVQLWKKCGLKKAAMPMEMVQGLLYQQERSAVNVCPEEVI
ncbi:fractalkine [Nothoprocta perdicaria]|uniref:fractalkine n=1 Tax=Nothoprocta perdicaria TaxID=30464 RepID=UPI000E1BCB01|nr:fractalkine [Nothoprocta perdicaria]